MTRTARAYTLWTNPMDERTTILDNVALTDADRIELKKAVDGLDETAMEERLRPFQTPVTSETLSQSVK